MNKNYGTNNSRAYNEGECPVALEVDGRHTWVFKREVGRCVTEYECSVCGAIHTINSSD